MQHPGRVPRPWLQTPELSMEASGAPAHLLGDPRRRCDETSRRALNQIHHSVGGDRCTANEADKPQSPRLSHWRSM